MAGSNFVERPDCPACGTRGKELFSRPFREPSFLAALDAFYAPVGHVDHDALEGGAYRVSGCDGCGTLFQSSIPSDALLVEVYERWIDPVAALERYHKPKAAHASLWMAREMALALSLADPLAPRRALDYGCGWGEWAVMARAFGFDSYATELSDARRSNAINLGVKVLGDREIPPDAFGLVNLDQVLEHLPSPVECLQLLSASLHPRGVLRVAVPHSRHVRAGLREFDREMKKPRLGRLNAIAPFEHLNAFTQTGLVEMARSAGLQRVLPRWGALLETSLLPAGVAGKCKALLLPLYLRGSSTTQLYFCRAQSRVPTGAAGN